MNSKSSENVNPFAKGKTFPSFFLTTAILFTAAVFVWFVGHIYHANFVRATVENRVIKISELRGRIVHLDEVLTMAAKMAAATGDAAWEKRYREFEPQLARAIREAETLTVDFENSRAAAAQADAANRRLVEMETRAFALVGEGRADAAREILFGGEYQAQKNLYAEAMRSFDADLRKFQDEQLHDNHSHWSVGLIIAALAFSLFAWLATIRRLASSSEKLLSVINEKERATEALRQSETRFRDLFENANDIIFTVDLQGNFTSLNKVAEKTTGYTAAEAARMNFAQIVAPESLALVRRMLADKLETDAPTEYETEIVTKSGKRLTLDVNSRLIAGEDGRAVGIQGIARDVTDSRRAAENLRKSEQYRNLFKHANDAILIFEPETEIVFEVNDKACEIYGRRREDFVGRSLKEMSQNVGRGSEELQKLLHDGVYDEFESVHLRGDGTPFHLVINAAVIEYQGRTAVLTINRDVTARKQMETALRESEEQFRAVTRSAQDAIISADGRGNIIFWNQGAERIFGYTEREAVGQSLQMIMPAAHRTAHQKGLERNVATGENRLIGKTVEVPGRRRDGGEFPLELSLGSWQTDKGKFFTAVLRDITERKVVEDALKESERRYRLMGEGIVHQVWTAQPDGNLDYVNQRTIEYFGNTMEEALGDGWQTVIHPDDLPTCAERWTRSLATGEPYEVEFRLRAADGAYRWHLGRATAGLDADGRIIKWFGTNTDIDDKKHAEEAVQKNVSLLTSTFEATADGVLVVNARNEIEIFNQNFARMWDISAERLKTLSTAETPQTVLEQIKNPEDYIEKTRQIDVRNNAVSFDELELKDGRIYERHSRPQKLNGQVIGRVFNFRDVTTRKRAEQQLMHDAFHDGLTGLANRALFMDHLRLTIERGKSRHSNPYAVLFLDFDRFKVVNDSLGHAEGDRLLQQIARRLEAATRTGDLVARLGGDEFVVLLSELLDESDAVQVAERIQENLKKSFDLGGHQIYISASIGIALSTAGHESPDDMLRDADIAMYRAKAGGRARHQIFDRRMHEQAAKQLSLETEMRQALEREEFLLHYQPIINLETESLMGFEALVRWRHPARGMVSPFEFIGAAEDNGLILPLGAWILQESCRQMRRWQDANSLIANLTVSVNLSSKQFSQPDLAEQIARTLEKSKLDALCLKLEITESHIMENSEQAIELMNRLRALGIELSLDDFGTGYSSLSYLHRLPASFLKIDRSFVTRMAESEENSEIVSTIIKLAQNLKMKVVAEGIETAEQLAHLKSLKCEFGQGYFFSKPLEAEAAEKFIEENLKRSSVLIDQSFVENQLSM